VQRRESVPTRAGLAPVVAVLAVAACVGLSACSPGADYPTLFPAVHDMPPPRADTPLDPVQVQQATEDLITARDHLSAEAQGSGQNKPAANAANKPKPGEKAAEKKKQPSTQAAAASGKPADATLAAGAEPKP
jgi:hypothetical protein